MSKSSGDRPVTVARSGATSTPWPNARWQVAHVFMNTALPFSGRPVSVRAGRNESISRLAIA